MTYRDPSIYTYEQAAEFAGYDPNTDPTTLIIGLAEKLRELEARLDGLRIVDGWRE